MSTIPAPLTMDVWYPAKWLGMNLIRILFWLATATKPIPRSDLTLNYLPSTGSTPQPKALRIHFPKTTKPEGLPIHVHVHGSGFCLPTYGMDDEYCRWLANAVPCVVVDVDHRKPPTYPAPIPANDIRDALRTTRSIGAERGWDTQRISIGGMSSGGCLSLIEAARAGKSEEPLTAVVAFYPS
jgi:acetyl esterase/lipase